MKTKVLAMAVLSVLLIAPQVGLAQAQGYGTPVAYFAPGMAGNPSTACTGQAGACPHGTGACDRCGDDSGCVDPWQVWGEFLYLRARNAEITYGVPTEGSLVGVTNPLQLGRMGVVDADYEPAVRFGIARAMDECSSLGIAYTHFDSESIDELHATAPQLLYPMVFNNAVLATDPVWRDSFARQDIDFRLVDAEYRRVFASCRSYDLTFLAGIRYARLKQESSIGFYTPGGTGVGDEYLFTHVNFDGAGVRLGLEGERRAAGSGLLVYGKTSASFVAGSFRADLFEARGNGLAAPATTIVDTSWKAGRLVTMLDLELGVGWTSPGGHLRLTGGYMVSGWYNVVKNSDWIQSVRTADARGLGDTMTFDGFVLRSELRF